MKNDELFEDYKQRLNILDGDIRKTALNYAAEIYFKNNCSKEEALEKGITRAELEERNLKSKRKRKNPIMDWTFENFNVELDSLNPQVKSKAIEIARNLINQENYSEKEAIHEGIKKAEEWFYDLEG